MEELPVLMPDGTPFAFWDDTTAYTRVYHVSCEHPAASDEEGLGTEERPFATLGRAAQVLQPGEKVIVHQGVYRECVRPARGGTGPEHMIAYEAAHGEEVRILGSERWTPTFAPSEGWNLGALPPGVTVWMADLPAEWFVGYNPFIARNLSSEYTTFTTDWTTEETHRLMLRRGTIYAEGSPWNGAPLEQVFRPQELAEKDGCFWVQDPGLRIHLRLWDDADPKDVALEVTTREQIFAPLREGLGYIRVSGFTFEYAADGVPVPQRAMVSATRGHHWIIEDNEIRWANACGIDVGNETWHRSIPSVPAEASGHHIIRRNHVADCGVCGIAAVGNNAHTLVEDNVVERIGGMNVERIWETGGLKFHTCDSVLIRRNTFRHICHAPGVWLDYLNRNSRITDNVFADITSIHSAVYIEVSHALNLVDHNLLWDIRGVGRPRSGQGINVDSGEQCVVAHNLFARIPDSYAVSVNLAQKGRIVGGRVGLCRQHKVLNNLFTACPRRILLARAADNQSEGNLFDERDDPTSLCVEYPEPAAILDMAAWQAYYGFDQQGGQAQIEVDLDPETLVLTVEVEGEIPECPGVPELHDGCAGRPPGPWPIEPGRRTYHVHAGYAL
jgi:hypothetical protein